MSNQYINKASNTVQVPFKYLSCNQTISQLTDLSVTIKTAATI